MKKKAFELLNFMLPLKITVKLFLAAAAAVPG
jgi:hypothetical protein